MIFPRTGRFESLLSFISLYQDQAWFVAFMVLVLERESFTGSQLTAQLDHPSLWRTPRGWGAVGLQESRT